MKDQRVSCIIFQTTKGRSYSASELENACRIFNFQTIELVRRPDRPCLLVGRFSRSTRPKESTLKTKFMNYMKSQPGFFDELKKTKLLECVHVKFDTSAVFFVRYPQDYVTGLCDIFKSVKERRDPLGLYEIINVDQYKNSGNGSFDVVKKHNELTAANEFVGADVSSALLGGEEAAKYFHSFSAEVHVHVGVYVYFF